MSETYFESKAGISRITGSLAQIQRATDVKRVVVGPSNILHRVILELGIGITGVPPLLERGLIIHVVHCNVLVGSLDDVLQLRVAEFGSRQGRGGDHQRCGGCIGQAGAGERGPP